MQSQQHPLKKQPSLMTLEYNSPVTATSSVHSTSTTSQNTSLLARMAGKAKSNNSREDSEKKPLPKSGILPIRTSSLRLGRRSNGNIRQETKTVDDKNGPGASTVHRTLSMKLPKGAGSIFSSNKSHETDNNNTPTKTKSTPRHFFASLGRRSKVPDSPRKEQNQIPPQMQSVQPNDSNSNSSTLKKTRLKSKRLSTFFH
ncbi:hypothetical protein BDC45DRAFT_513532 [Circinella umbellata]|nr:hypothetical protein BDC45DRAFT_513532 [Circinella umbellata]